MCSRGSYLCRCIFGIRNSDVHRDEAGRFVAREDRGRCICIGRRGEKMRNTNGNVYIRSSIRGGHSFISYANSSLTKGEGEYIYFLSFFFFETMNGTVEYLLVFRYFDRWYGRQVKRRVSFKGFPRREHDLAAPWNRYFLSRPAADLSARVRGIPRSV